MKLLSSKKGMGNGGFKFINAIMALVTLAGGALPLLVQFKVIEKIPTYPSIIISILLIVAGIFLFIDTFMIRSY